MFSVFSCSPLSAKGHDYAFLGENIAEDPTDYSDNGESQGARDAKMFDLFIKFQQNMGQNQQMSKANSIWLVFG